MRRASQIALAAALIVGTVVHLGMAQNATHPSTVVGSAGNQSQETPSKFLGSAGAGRSSWQAGKESFGKAHLSKGPQWRMFAPGSQEATDTSGAAVVARCENARLNLKTAGLSEALKANEPRTPFSRPTAPSAQTQARLAPSHGITQKKHMRSQTQFGTFRKSVNSTRSSDSGAVLFGGNTKTAALGSSTNSSAKSQLGRIAP